MWSIGLCGPRTFQPHPINKQCGMPRFATRLRKSARHGLGQFCVFVPTVCLASFEVLRMTSPEKFPFQIAGVRRDEILRGFYEWFWSGPGSANVVAEWFPRFLAAALGGRSEPREDACRTRTNGIHPLHPRLSGHFSTPFLDLGDAWESGAHASLTGSGPQMLIRRWLAPALP